MVSGGFTLFTNRVAAMIGFDENRANTLTVVDGHKLAGTVAEPIFGRDGKRAALIELRQELGLAKDDTMAIGDGANDMDMIAEAGLGVAFHAKPKVAAAAPARIDHGDLSALLYVQGYRQDNLLRHSLGCHHPRERTIQRCHHSRQEFGRLDAPLSRRAASY